MNKKMLLTVMVAVLAAGAVSAQVTVSVGGALSYCNAEAKLEGGGSMTIEGDIGVGGNLLVDYMLPISVPMSLGFEIGVDGAKIKQEGVEVNVTAIPLMLRIAYHFDIDPKLDLFAVGKLGYAIGSGKTESDTEDGYGGFGFGIDLGMSYYFASTIGLFAEVGFEDYMLSKKFEGYTINVPFYRFLTVGLSFKF